MPQRIRAKDLNIEHGPLSGVRGVDYWCRNRPLQTDR